MIGGLPSSGEAKERAIPLIRELIETPTVSEVLKCTAQNYLGTIGTEYEKDGANAFLLSIDENVDFGENACSCPACTLGREIYSLRDSLLSFWMDVYY